MASALLLTGIGPSGWETLLYETLILTNQGVAYLYVMWDKILPALGRRIAVRGDVRAPDGRGEARSATDCRR